MATPEATENYFKRLKHKNIPNHAIRILGKTHLHVASIGFGGYRIHYNSIEHARALRYALLNGFNLIDTSSNYTDGGSEMLIGNLLHEMFERQEISRDEVIVVSKVGYVQGQNMKLAQQKEADGEAFPEMVKYMDGCWHCLHPEFLEDQLSRSLERLHLSYLDVYLLHNPEYFLSLAKKNNGVEMESGRTEYYRRIKSAFEWLEEKVAEGKIKAYGVSSNTFPVSSLDFEFTSLERLIEIAHEITSSHYFRVIQFPFNLFEACACLKKNQKRDTKTLLELAAEEQIGTLVNRPLNAMGQNGMVRLASFRETEAKEVEREFTQTLGSLQTLESQFKRKFFKETPAEMREILEDTFSLAPQLKNALHAFENWHHWDHVKQNVIWPRSVSALNYLDEKLRANEPWKNWSDSYAVTLHALLDAISKQYENAAQKRSNEISTRLDKREVLLQSSETLSQKALQILTSVQGVDCTLLGMRKTPYVEDALVALTRPSVPRAGDFLKNFATMNIQPS
ncbi:MAG: aldo/keto reductase [bacterium]